MAKSNPNGANGSTSDPREQSCWDFYVESLTGEDKGNARQSALKAGYSVSEAKNVTLRGWFKARLDRLRRRDMLSDSERNLKELLNLKTTSLQTVAGKAIRQPDSRLLSIKKDVSVTIAKTLGKEYYTERQELTGKDGEKLFEIDEEKKEVISEKLNGIL